MHEVGMCEGVLAAVEARAGDRTVARIGVRAGTSLRVVPEAFQTAFELVAAGGVAADAVTEVTVVPIRARCVRCSQEFETEDPFPACPSCGGVELQRDLGNELTLEWIEYVGPAQQPAGR